MKTKVEGLEISTGTYFDDVDIRSIMIRLEGDEEEQLITLTEEQALGLSKAIIEQVMLNYSQEEI